MRRVNICSVDPSLSRPLRFALACCQSTAGLHLDWWDWWAHSRGREATPHTNGLWLLYCWHHTGFMVALHLSFSWQTFSGFPKQSERGFIKENDFTPVLSGPLPVPFADYQSVPDAFLSKVMTSWHRTILQKSSSRCACRCTLTCLLLFLSKLWTGGGLTRPLIQL